MFSYTVYLVITSPFAFFCKDLLLLHPKRPGLNWLMTLPKYVSKGAIHHLRREERTPAPKFCSILSLIWMKKDPTDKLEVIFY